MHKLLLRAHSNEKLGETSKTGIHFSPILFLLSLEEKNFKSELF